ncbi:hypothetical protein QBC44DRAFT_294939 [Cladorrhinum sp. PSN332]|nr:hypothetical protein QBC44DRAFT_294939 [Cladorrhinum sp. PSN332]
MSGIEILGVVASVGALIDVADRAYKVVFRYFPAVKNSREDVQRLITEIRTLCGVLHSLKLFATSLEDGVLVESDAKALRMHHVESCYHALSKIRADLEKYEDDLNGKNKLKRLHRSLTWPFNEEGTTKLLERVNADKQTINLAMTVDTTNALLRKLSRHHQDSTRQMAEIRCDVQKTLQITRRVHISSKRRQVLEFFNRSEPQASELFETSVARKFPMTGLWLTHGDQFRDWLSTPRSRLWLGGIPGAGKTVLAGAMIEEALSFCNPGCAVAFFFCDSSKGPATSLTDLLGVLVAQLARQSDKAFDILQHCYAELNPEQGIIRSATVQRLSTALIDMIGSYDRVYIIVDGLDEYGREVLDIMMILTHVWSATETCSIALVSRDEPHIRDALEHGFQHIQVRAHKEDIEPYVIAKIQEHFGDQRKRNMSDQTKEAITKALVERSDGMWRWVTCQIDYISGFLTDRDRLEALNDLPPDLGKTYERVLDRVNQQGQHIQGLIQRVLSLIAFREKPITIPELREAVSSHISHPDDLITEDDIALKCSSLIRKSNDGLRFEFAHFTVTEFLRSNDLFGTPYEMYRISSRRISVILASTSIRFLLQPDFSHVQRDFGIGAKRALDRVQQHPFYSYAAKYWTSTRNRSWSNDDQVHRLLLKLFAWPKSGNCTNWAVELGRNFLRPHLWFHTTQNQQQDYDEAEMEKFNNVVAGITRADFTPLHLASLLAIPWLTKHLLSRGIPIDSNSRVGTPLHCAVTGPLIFTPSKNIRGCLWLSGSEHPTRASQMNIRGRGAEHGCVRE